ncbi:MAG: glycosyltransferase family 9 protein [Candidatus Nitrohelix vancouverensis]|uniref:Glycosyltransferase family 9 protein n=1 Tax=Candidatus Nitrohelix vancouverensis TaxID=2705534 RepID=A0A7T0C284_9BACT|nr:MAG: glycosyltransferase family 9 protein [Candidatus Nitrohelix vancouverensis]
MKRILVVSSTGMGDSLWGSPALRALKKSFPETSIDLLALPQWTSLFDHNPHLASVLSYHPQWGRQLVTAARLSGRAYDHALLFHVNKDFRRMLPLLRCSSFLAHQEFDWLPSISILRFDARVHGIQRRLELIKQIGAEPDGSQMELVLSEEEKEEARLFLTRNGLDRDRSIYLNLGASLPHKRWPVERCLQLTGKILRHTPCSVLLGGGPEEKPMIDQALRQFKGDKVAGVCDRPIRANAALIERAIGLVTTDTGPMHLGLALKTPTLALFGPTRPEESGPYQIDPSLCSVIRASSQGTPLSDRSQNVDFNYFDPISVEVVWEELQKLFRLG